MRFDLRLLAALAVVAIDVSSAGASEAPLVAAASDLNFALTEISAAYTHDAKQAVRVTFGSSGNFARQIEQGAPFQLFFSADEILVARLKEKNLTRDDGALYAIGRVALFVPKGSALKLDLELNHLRTLVKSNPRFKFAIANPEHAPYGRAAQQVLTKLQLWQPIQPHLVLGENVSQAAQFAASSSTMGGIIAYSLAMTPQMNERGSHVLLPDNLHQPLRQRMVLLKNATPAAENFYRYVQSSAARGILKRYGFTLPEE